MLTQIRERPHDVRHLTVFAKSMIRKKPASGLDAGGGCRLSETDMPQNENPEQIPIRLYRNML
jgi:hypothetical protein